MSAGRLIGALSSLLLILLAGLPTSEAIKCPVGGYCEWTGNPINTTTIELSNKECKDACFRFGCVVEDKNMYGWGCEDDFKAVCPDVTDANITALKTGAELSFLIGDSYFGFGCQKGNCINDLKTNEGFKKALERVLHMTDKEVEVRVSVITAGTNTDHPCDYTGTGGKPAASTDNAAILSGVPMILGWIMVGWIAAQF